MYELNKTSSYEPVPLWSCQHIWMNIGALIIHWDSYSTDYGPPADASIKQKRKCLVCGGVEWHEVDSAEHIKLTENKHEKRF